MVLNLKDKNRSKFQHFPLKKVDQSPWPILVSFALLKLIKKLSKFIVKTLSCIILFIIFIHILTCLIKIYSNWHSIDWVFNVISEGGPATDNSPPMDPPRWWPSGVPQSTVIVGTALTTYYALNKISNISPRLRVLGALGSAGVTAAQITYHSAIVNSLGFNRLMWGLSEYSRTGKWPGLEDVAKNVPQSQLDNIVKASMEEAETQTVESVVTEVSSRANSSEFFPSLNLDLSDLFIQLTDFLFKETVQLFKLVPVQGFLDDLIGQRMFVEVILLISVISIILLFIFFLLNLVFLLNKDRIIKKFDNKFITLYMKYQGFLSRLSLIYSPIFIFIGLFTLFHGLHWLVTNQIPYESLDIDLHQFVSSSNSNGSASACLLGLRLSFNKFKLD